MGNKNSTTNASSSSGGGGKNRKNRSPQLPKSVSGKDGHHEKFRRVSTSSGNQSCPDDPVIKGVEQSSIKVKRQSQSDIVPANDDIFADLHPSLSSEELATKPHGPVPTINTPVAERAMMNPSPPAGQPRSYVSPRISSLMNDPSSPGAKSGSSSPDQKPTACKGIDYRLTEGANRRNLMADCEGVCSKVSEDYLYVGGHRIAQSLEILNENEITQIVNCSASVVECYFIGDPNFSYLSLNMVDGRQDDITWFVCAVIRFVEKGRISGLHTLIHCEKGISRSCSFSMAYIMWKNGLCMKDAYEQVKSRREVANPNSAFTCQLLELEELFSAQGKLMPLLFRCAVHTSHDPFCPVLKLCRYADTRKMVPISSHSLDPQGVFVIRGHREAAAVVNSGGSLGDDNGLCNVLFVWQGCLASDDIVNVTEKMCDSFRKIFVSENAYIEKVRQGKETPEFWETVLKCRNNGETNSGSSTDVSYGSGVFDDIYVGMTENDMIERDCSGTLTAMSLSPTKEPTYPTYEERGADDNHDMLPNSTAVTSQTNHFEQKMKDLAISIPDSKLKKSPKEKVVNEVHAKKFSLPLAGIQSEISPSIAERHPDFVDVLRAPVSSEELIQLKRGGNSSDLSVNKKPSESSIGGSATSSPSGKEDALRATEPSAPIPLQQNSPPPSSSSLLPAADVIPAPTPSTSIPINSTAVQAADVISAPVPSLSIPIKSSATPAPAPANSGGGETDGQQAKTRLYQAVRSGEGYEWSDLGTVFDEEDLDPEFIFLLIFPTFKEKLNFLWLGDKFQYNQLDASMGTTGMDITSDWQPDASNEEDIAFCISYVSRFNLGDLKNIPNSSEYTLDDMFDGGSKCTLIVSGIEPDEWWEAFDGN